MKVDLEFAYTYCKKIAKKYAKNFYIASITLPPREKLGIYASYAFCRICDDIADGEFSIQQKKTMFAHTKQLLTESKTSEVTDPVFTALRDTSSYFCIPDKYFEEIIEGVEMDLNHVRYQNFDELKNYCYKVASVVGLISIKIFGYKNSKAENYAIDLGIAMQLTNIIRDVKEDLQKDRIYLPLDEITKFGYTTQELENQVSNESFQNLIQFQVSRAREYFDSGLQLIPLISPRSRICLELLSSIYSAILDRIEKSGYNVFQERHHISTLGKFRLIGKIWTKNLFRSYVKRK